MDETGNNKAFLNYPVPKCGPDIPYKNERKQNIALRGIAALVGAFLLEWFPFLRKNAWRDAGFGRIRLIRKYLEDYEPRFEPTVIPVVNRSSSGDQAPPVASSSLKPLQKRLMSKYYSVADYHALYTSGEVTPIAVAKAILPLIRRDISPPGKHSVAWFNTRVDDVLAAAEASTLRYKENRPLGIFDGVPTAIKDEYDMDGYKTTLGSLNDYTNKTVPGQSITSWSVRKMEEAGAIILGKLSMHEFGLDTSGSNPHYGTPLNPYNSHYYTGGSSSGCAYAVSTGLIPIALGGDGGGSIRIPSSFCSVYGLKPSHNRVSFYPCANHSNTCAVNGPLAADIGSLTAFYDIIGIPDPSSLFPSPARQFSGSFYPNKILGIPEAWFSKSDPAIQVLCRSLLDKLVSVHGYRLVPIQIPFLAEGQIAHAMTVLTDAATLLPETKAFTAPNRVMIALGTVTPATDYLLAQKLRQLLMRHLAYLWKCYPGMIIVTPTTSCAGWPIRTAAELKYGVSDGDQTVKTMEYVWMGNFTGIPALSVPAGFVDAEKGIANEKETAKIGGAGSKIPVGLMGMGEWASEDHLLQWGLEVEEVGADRQCRPPVWVDVIERAKKVMEETDEA